jgi:hypothetical protein
MGYEPISAIAPGLLTDEETLLDFHRKGWIDTVQRGSTVFLSSDQRYRAKYILHLLQTKQLSDDQIQLVLSVQRPPYSAAGVDQILREHTPPIPGDGGA